MSVDMDKAMDLLMKLVSNEPEETDSEDYNEISEEISVENEETADEGIPNLQNLFGSFSDDDDKRVTLLSSIKPYMNGKRQGKVDAAIQIVRFISLSSGLGLTNLFKQ